MRILISNDDGIQAPGLVALCEVLKEIAEIIVIAPDRNRSGAAHSLTLDMPIRIRTLEKNRIAVEGTPVDCIHLALTGLLDRKPDLVLSGINGGANLGDDVLYSGTVAAAVEARYFGIPAIALSLVGQKDHLQEGLINFDSAAKVSKQLVERVIEQPLPQDTILNVNIPDCVYSDLNGFSVTRLGTRNGAEPYITQIDPRGRTHYWIGPPGPEKDNGDGTDFQALRAGRVTVTPMEINFTHYERLDHMSAWAGNLSIDKE